MDFAINNVLLRAGVHQDLPAGIHHAGMTVGMVGEIHVPGCGAGGVIDLVVQRPGPHQGIPMERSGNCIELSWHADQQSALLRHGADQLRKALIKADGNSHLPEGGVEQGLGFTGGKAVRFPEADLAGNVHIKEMDLPVPGHQLSPGIETEAAVVDLLPFPLGNGAANQIHAVLPGPSGHPSHPACCL